MYASAGTWNAEHRTEQSWREQGINCHSRVGAVAERSKALQIGGSKQIEHLGGAVVEYSMALLVREKINIKQKILGSSPKQAILGSPPDL